MPARMLPGAFGLAIRSDAGLPGLAAPGAVAGARRVDHRLADGGTARELPLDDSTTPLGGSGEGPLRVEYERRPDAGLAIRSESFGDHLIGDGGRSVLSAIGGVERELWQRYVLGQVLPLTASIQGLEIFHASAVATGGGVVALAGPSGAGKSSIAAAMVASGDAAFYADDVLALDATAFGLTAYPGTTLMGLPHDRSATLDALFDGPAWIADERKVLAPVRGERRALPVRAFVRLAPAREAGEVSFARCLPDRLMATTFDGVSRAPERLLRLLRVSAMLAAESRALELRYPPDSEPEAVAAALLERLDLAAAPSGRA